MIGRYIQITLVATLALTVLVLPIGAQAARIPKRQEVFDPQAQMLIDQLSRYPELMNIEYLKFFIGRPDNEYIERGKVHKNFTWYDRNHVIQYELHQSEIAPGQVVDSMMIVHLRGMGLTFDMADKLYGQASKKFFDYNGQPSELFARSPNTFLSFSSPANTFRLNEASIAYGGPPLPMPSAEAMYEAQTQMVANAAAIGSAKVVTGEAIPILEARVKTMPDDCEAHLMLAQAFQNQSRLNEAIGEYKVALAMSSTNDAVRDSSIAALRSMHIISDDDPLAPPRELRMMQHGQRLRVDDRQKQDDKDHRSD